MRRIAIFLALTGLGLVVGCGDDDTSSATTDTTGATTEGGEEHDEHDESSDAADDARVIEVSATSFEFTPSEISVEAGEEIAIEFTSDDILHDFTIDELDAHVAAEAGESETGGFRADEPGEYTYYCSVDGHREAGMEGTLVVE